MIMRSKAHRIVFGKKVCLQYCNRPSSFCRIAYRLSLFLSFLFLFSACRKKAIEIQWVEQYPPIETHLDAVFFTDENTGHIVGGDTWQAGYYLYTEDGGDTWEADSLCNKRLFALTFLDDGFGATVGVDGYLFRKQNADADWVFQRLPYWYLLRDVAFTNRTEGIFVGGNAYRFGVILKMQNYSLTRRDTFEHELAAVCFSNDSTVYAVGYGAILRSTNAGDHWKRMEVYGDFFRAIHFPSSTVGYIVGSGGTILKTMDGGEHWQKIRDGSKFSVSNVPFRDVFFVDESHGYVVGEQGTFWRTDDGGNTWLRIKDFPDVDILSIHLVGDKGYLVTAQGRIFQFVDD